MTRRAQSRLKQPYPLGATKHLPLVAIVGRPNVGKSTLFNRLIGQRLAVVEDQPGVTRDLHYAVARFDRHMCLVVDTGGFSSEQDSSLKERIVEQVHLALEESDAVIAVFDATGEPTAEDHAIVDLLRRSQTPTLFVVNKAESREQKQRALEFYSLGLQQVEVLSALHGDGLGELEERIEEMLSKLPVPTTGEATVDADSSEALPRIAIVGRPNAGKSSLVNRLLGRPQQLVDDQPGTTVDSIDSLFDFHGEPWVLVDTAGIRRRTAVKRGVESRSVLQAIRAMQRSNLVVLLIDAHAGTAEQDARLAALAQDRGCALVVALNKMDLLSEDEKKQAQSQLLRVMHFASWAPKVSLSTLNGRGIGKLLDVIKQSLDAYQRRVPTAELNRFLEELSLEFPPPASTRRPVRLYYGTQAQSAPPLFVFSAKNPAYLPPSYQRFVLNRLRETFGFVGVPLRVRYRDHRGPSQ